MPNPTANPKEWVLLVPVSRNVWSLLARHCSSKALTDSTILLLLVLSGVLCRPQFSRVAARLPGLPVGRGMWSNGRLWSYGRTVPFHEQMCAVAFAVPAQWYNRRNNQAREPHPLTKRVWLFLRLCIALRRKSFKIRAPSLTGVSSTRLLPQPRKSSEDFVSKLWMFTVCASS